MTSIANACGECHALNRDLFNGSPHKRAFAEMELGECTTCHGDHDVGETSDGMIGVTGNSMCIDCHEEGDHGYQAAALMRAQLDSLVAIIDSSSSLLERAVQGGVDVKGGRFDLQQARNSLIKARGAVHAFDPDQFVAITQAGMADARIVKEVGEAAIRDLQMRRIGLAFSIPLILVVALILIWKIRRLESSPRAGQQKTPV